MIPKFVLGLANYNNNFNTIVSVPIFNMPSNLPRTKAAKKTNSAKKVGEKKPLLERVKGWFTSSKKSRPQPVRQYTYPRLDTDRQQLFPEPSNAQVAKRQNAPFINQFDKATDADRAGFLGWKKSVRSYNNALVSSKAQQRAEKAERKQEQKELAKLKDDVARYYGRPGSKALVDAYNRHPEEQERYERFLEEYANLAENVNHAELHGRVGPAYIYSPFLGKKKTTTPPGNEAVNTETLAKGPKVLDKSNQERAEREEQRRAEKQRSGQNSARPSGERHALANESRKVNSRAPLQSADRKPAPSNRAGSVKTSPKQKHYQAYKPARKEPEPTPHDAVAERDHRADSHRARNIPQNPASNQPAHHGRRYDDAANRSSESKKGSSSRKPHRQLSAASPEHDPQSFREREKRLPGGNRTEDLPSRRPTHFRGKALDYSHLQEEFVHPAFRQEVNPPAPLSEKKGGTYLDYKPLPLTPSPHHKPPRHASRHPERSAAAAAAAAAVAAKSSTTRNARQQQQQRGPDSALEKQLFDTTKPRQWEEVAVPPAVPRPRRTEVSRFSDWGSDDDGKKDGRRIERRARNECWPSFVLL